MSENEIIQRLIERSYLSEEIGQRGQRVYETILRRSAQIQSANFERISVSDLTLLYELYDEHFYKGDLQRLVAASGAPLIFELSRRLTRSAGVTRRHSTKAKKGQPPPPPTRFEIALSMPLLFQSFREVERPIHVNGLICKDRLEAAMRVFEHELTHLVEMLVWRASNCDQPRFKNLVRNYFGHLQTRHDLVTQRERARARFDLRVGDRVDFEFDGRRHEGFINRITQRATVLVESRNGEPYSDGKRYLKFYVPLARLKRRT